MAFLEITKDVYVHSLWFCGNDEGDWFAAITKEVHEGELKWLVRWRFRYTKDEKVWNSADEKNHYLTSAPATEDPDDLLKAMEEVAFLIALRYQRDVICLKLECQGNDKKVGRALKEFSFFHISTLSERN